ncbi:cytochrome aa3 quinol oxidase subunit II, partial [Staphylococcus simulans]
GMKAMILGNKEPYDGKFKKDESHNMDEMEKISKGAKDKEASKIENKDQEHGGGH